MAIPKFDRGKIERWCGGNITYWSYHTEDTLADVLEPGYFDSFELLRALDRIELTAGVGTDDPCCGCLLVVRADHGTVEVQILRPLAVE